MISVAVVDDMHLMRNMFVNFLHELKGVQIWGDFTSGSSFIEALKKSKNKPDIAIIDVKMPDMNGIEVCSWVTMNTSVKVLMLSQYDQEACINAAVKAGASGYLLKNVLISDIEKAINEAYKKGYYFCDYFTPKLIRDVNKDKGEVVIRSYYDLKPLTKREIEITKLICKEMPYKEIASQLGITLGTVDELKTRAMRKIGAKKVTGLVIYASYKGWV